jgi:hypothetical protein
VVYSLSINFIRRMNNDDIHTSDVNAAMEYTEDNYGK